jgi:DNA-binding CsgD family transcriptional regulator
MQSTGQTVTDTRGGQRCEMKRDGSDRAEALAELLHLRRQLERVAETPAVGQAHQLTAHVAQILEPVWSIVNPSHGVGGVGFIRRYGVPDPAAAAINAAVTEQAVNIYGSLDLVAPSTRDVWRSLARPAEALWHSVQDKPCRPPEGGRSEFERSVMTVTPTVRPMLPPPLLGHWRLDSEVVPAMRKVLRRWCELARRSTGDQAYVARLTLAAAMLARGAVLDGDTATVKWFIGKWLGLRATEPRVDGASAALLENGWTVPVVDSDLSAVLDAVTTLRVQSAYQHRLHRPVWETQLRGLPVALLSEEEWQPVDGGRSLELSDTLPDLDTVSVSEAVEHTLFIEQLHYVLDSLSKREAEIIYDLASGETRKQTMQKHGITRYRLDQIERAVMLKLRHPSRSQVLRDYLD